VFAGAVYCCRNVQVKVGGVGHDASKVRVYGDGVKPTGVLASLPVSFTVDTSQAGVADVDILIEVRPPSLSPRRCTSTMWLAVAASDIHDVRHTPLSPRRT